MQNQKTLPGDQSVLEFLHSVENEQRRNDSLTLLNIMQEVTGEDPKLWGGSMIGFGTYNYTYESGHSGISFISGFAPRKQQLVVYIMSGFEKYDLLMEKLGKYKTGKSCLYLKTLSDVDEEVLRELIAESVAYMKKRWP